MKQALTLLLLLLLLSCSNGEQEQNRHAANIDSIVITEEKAFSHHWEPIHETDEYTDYIYTEINLDQKGYWIWKSRRNKNKEKTIYEKIELYLFNEQWNKYCFKYTISFDKKGWQVEEHTFNDFDWRYIVPGTDIFYDTKIIKELFYKHNNNQNHIDEFDNEDY